MNPSTLLSPDQALQQQAQQSQQAAAQAQQASAAQPAHSGNWLTHLLPTIGGIGAALLAPETGGLSLLAAAGLGAAGSAAGKLAENATEGKGLTDDVATAGIEGGIGGGVGGAAGKLIGKGAEMLGNRGANIAAKEATDNAAQDAITGTANAYKDVSPQAQARLGAKDAIDHVNGLGYDATDPKNLVHVGEQSNDILNLTLNKALADAGPIDVSHYPQLVKDALAKESGTLGSYEPVAASRGRFSPANTPSAKLLSQLENLGAGVTKTSSDPNEIRTLTTKLGQLAQDAKPMATAAKGAVDPEQRAAYNVINDVRGQIKDALYNRPGLNDAIKGLQGSIVPDTEANITPELAQHLNDVISKAGTGNKLGSQDILDAISKNINIKQLGDEGLKASQIVTSKGGQARAAAEAGLEGGAQSTAPGLMDGVHVLASPHTSFVNTAIKGAVHASQNPAILSTLSRIGGMGEKLAPAAGISLATAPNLQADPVAASAPNGTMGDNMQLQAHGNDTGNLISTIEALSVLDPSHYGAQGQSVLQLAPFLQKNQMLQGVMSGLPASYANAGGAQGTGGIMSRIAGLVPGTAAHTYQAQQQAAAQQLAQTMGISPEAAAGLLPQLMQNGQSAGLTQGILGNLQHQLAY